MEYIRYDSSGKIVMLGCGGMMNQLNTGRHGPSLLMSVKSFSNLPDFIFRLHESGMFSLE